MAPLPGPGRLGRPKKLWLYVVKADFIVVGAGTAGCVVANRLTEDSKTDVLLVEAGGYPPIQSVEPALPLYNKNEYETWNYKITDNGDTFQSHKNNTYDMVQAKMLGGCSSLNNLNYYPVAPRDFNRWAKITNNPKFAWDSVEKYLIKIENMQSEKVLNSPNRKYYGTKGYLKLTVPSFNKIKKYLDGFKNIGENIIDVFTPKDFVGYGTPTQTVANGLRQSTAYAFLTPIRNRKNLDILINTEVIRIVFKGKRAIGVKAMKDGKEYFLKARKGVIISAGAINSPKLLMLSGIGPAEHLKRLKIKVRIDLPVGERLQDHVVALVFFKTGIKYTDTLDPSKPGPVILGASSLTNSTTYADYLSTTNILNQNTAKLYCADYHGIENKICDSIFKKCSNCTYLMTYLGPTCSIIKGQVKLQSSNYKDAPKVLYEYASDRQLMKFVKYLKDFLKVSKSESFKRLGIKFLMPELPKCKNLKPKSNKYWKCYIPSMLASFGHYSATCANAVDSRLKVKYTKNLYTADTSIFPDVNSGGTAGPVMMVGEVVSDIIKEDYGIEN